MHTRVGTPMRVEVSSHLNFPSFFLPFRLSTLHYTQYTPSLWRVPAHSSISPFSTTTALPYYRHFTLVQHHLHSGCDDKRKCAKGDG
mmetsp:Transcript_32776/g.84656  ORF Transcript_32776/g.84656 Transcript_32776/m.84656 type:complete len:87 (+) Transcript_32776:125-385(+)